MKQVALGRTGEMVSAISLGCMYFGTKVKEEASFLLLDEYCEAGGTFLDTANCYAFWVKGGTGDESESILGRWMKRRNNRNQIFLATKVGARPDHARAGARSEIREGLSAKAIEKAVHDSLRRLGTDHVDLLYTHVPDRSVPLEETLAALDRLVRAGNVRFIACSNEVAWRIERARNASTIHGWALFCCVQNRYTYLRPKLGAVLPQICIEGELLDYARENPEVTLLGYSPLLGGAYARERELIPQEYRTSDSSARWDALEKVASETGASPTRVVLAWMMCGTPGIIPLIAASAADQLREDLSAQWLSLSPEQIQFLTHASGNEDKK